MVGSPPGLPGGGIHRRIARSPASARDFRIERPRRAHHAVGFRSLSPSGSPDERPTVDPSGMAVPAPVAASARN